MVPLTTITANRLIRLLLENTDMPNIGDATGLRGSTVAGVFWFSLHTSAPGLGGDQETNEATYGSYARVSVVRSSAGWTAVGGAGDNDALVTFPAATSGSETITHIGVGSDTSGVGNLTMYAALDISLAVSAPIQPEFALGALNWIAS